MSSLSQEVTVGFPEEILTYPGGSGNVDGAAVGFWDILSFIQFLQSSSGWHM